MTDFRAVGQKLSNWGRWGNDDERGTTNFIGPAHVFYDDKLYNGFPASDVSVKGAKHCSIIQQAKGIVGRGVLLDICGQQGVDWLEQGFVITPEHLDQACQEAGLTVGTGDIV